MMKCDKCGHTCTESACDHVCNDLDCIHDVHKFTYNVAEYKALGISPSDVADIIGKWGSPVLQIVVDGLRNGLTLTFLREILELLGPIFLKSAVATFLAKKKFGDHIWTGDQTDGTVNSPLVDLLQTLVQNTLKDPKVKAALVAALKIELAT